MAHLINSLAYAGRTPWHRLGNRMTDAERRDIAAAIQASGIGWDVAELVLNATINGQTIAISDAKGIYRTDTGAYLATVGREYTAIQNREALSIIEPLIEQGCTIEVMGALDGGKRIIALLRMPNDAIAIDDAGDDVRGYLLLQNSHDGSGALRVTLTPIRVVCQNTLTLANSRAHATAISIRHTRSASDRVRQAREIVERMGEAFAATGDTFKALASKRMGPREIAAYIESVIPGAINPESGKLPPAIVARRETIADLVFSGRGHKGNASTGESSAWFVYNAVTEYFDHRRIAECKSDSARIASADSALFGGNATIKAKALALASELVAA